MLIQLDEIKTNPAEDGKAASSASGAANTVPELAARALDKDLNAAALSAASKVALSASAVTDLTGLVKKKKKGKEADVDPSSVAESTNGLKRKTTEELVLEGGADKRARIAEEPPSS